ncbi:MAG: RIP metalloprotease RseP [Cytophagaceae bacterium]|nr:RIP metalloprotease RseP [Cytophagaceae bacterium]|tara:strand:- start:5637 stop:6974 length:1338 start_codon:yes stop_codon:yes gene_type:complete
MDIFFIRAGQLILSLSILIVLHEFGHFIPARLFKIRVEKFFLFFDVKFALFKKKIGETVYGIGWLPLGGYVKISGMIDESMDKEQMAEEPKPWEFRSKPAWQRLIVMIGGVTVNIILGFLIYILIIAGYGRTYTTADDMKYGFGVYPTMEQYGFQQGDKIVSVNGKPLLDQVSIRNYIMVRDVANVTVMHENGQEETLQLPEDIGSQLFQKGEMFGLTATRFPFTTDSILPDSPAAKAGLRTTDKVVKVNGEAVKYKSDIDNALIRDTTETVKLTILRDGQPQDLDINTGEDGKLGVYFKNTDPDYIAPQHTMKYSFGESITEGIKHGYWTLHDYVVQFKYVFTSKGATQVGGFGAIAQLFPPAWDWLSFWETTAFISIILAFMNILPIPALDGGHVMFLLYEIITGRKPSDKFMEYAQIAGFFLLIALVLFANGNDLYRAIFGD